MLAGHDVGVRVIGAVGEKTKMCVCVCGVSLLRHVGLTGMLTAFLYLSLGAGKTIRCLMRSVKPSEMGWMWDRERVCKGVWVCRVGTYRVIENVKAGTNEGFDGWWDFCIHVQAHVSLGPCTIYIRLIT
jgi:hypothetical protein